MGEDKYEINVQCNNCDFKGNIEVKKGTKIEDEKCPNCGCQTITKQPIYSRLTAAQEDNK